jgi:hypothetical protein
MSDDAARERDDRRSGLAGLERGQPQRVGNVVGRAVAGRDDAADAVRAEDISGLRHAVRCGERGLERAGELADVRPEPGVLKPHGPERTTTDQNRPTA